MNKQIIILVQGKQNILLANTTTGVRDEQVMPLRSVQAIRRSFALIAQRRAVLGRGDCAIAYHAGRYVLVTNFKKS